MLLLDEPTTDMAHQLEVLSLLDRLNDDNAMGVTVAAGPPEAVRTPETLGFVFGIHADLIVDPRSGRSICVPYALVR